METWFGLRSQETKQACERAFEHLDRAELSGSRLAHNLRNRLIATYVYVPDPVDDSIASVRSLRVGEHGLLAQAWERSVIGRLHAMKGEFDRARELMRGARQAYLDAGMLQSAGGAAMSEARMEWLAGDDAAAERVLRDGLASLEAIGERAFYPTAALQLAALLYSQGRYDEVREWCEKARAATGEDDVTNLIDLDLLGGLLLARAGRFDQAEEAASRAMRLLDGIDMNEIEAQAHRHLAELFTLTEKPDAAREHASTSIAIAERKGDVALAARMRKSLLAAGVEV